MIFVPHAILALAVAGTLVGCDRLGVSTTAADGSSGKADAPLLALDPAATMARNVAFEPLATLAPGRTTLLAALPDGNVYAIQADATPADATQPGAATGSSADVAAANSAAAAATSGSVLHLTDGAARPTALTVDAVRRALGFAAPPNAAAIAAPAAPTTSSTSPDPVAGRFTALAARADGKLAFCFAGVEGPRPFVAIGTFDPAAAARPEGAGAAIYVPVDQILLGNAGDADLATDPARPSLFTAGDDAWLWRATQQEIRLVSVQGLSAASPVVRATRLQVESARDATTDDLERSAWEWSLTARRGEFLLTDVAKRWIRRIDERGALAHVARFDADAVATLSAAAQDAAGRTIVFACDREGVVDRLLMQDNATFRSLPRSAFTVREGSGSPLATDRLRIDRLVPLPREANAFVAYDATSGTVLRVQLR